MVTNHDPELARLTDLRDNLRAKYTEAIEAGATEVTIDGVTVRRIAVGTLRREIAALNGEIYRHRVTKGGGSFLGGQVRYVHPD